MYIQHQCRAAQEAKSPVLMTFYFVLGESSLPVFNILFERDHSASNDVILIGTHYMQHVHYNV